MMNPVEQHPPRDRLAAFSAGKLNAVESDEVEQHLAQCESCCHTLNSLPNDTLAELLRDPASETSVAPDSPGVAPTILPHVDAATRQHAGDATQASPRSSGLESLELPPELRDHDRYRVVELLGHGGMGDVYRAEHRVMNRAVALKVIKPELVKSDAAVRRFRREVQAAARLHHPNIVTAHDAEQAGDLHYLVMEFVEGVDLDAIIRQRGALPVTEACDYVRQAADGLQHAHELGMVHRDIKPHNLVVAGEATGAPTVKILDFGLANFASEATADEDRANEDPASQPTPARGQLTQMGTMMGTPDYIAPEQAEDAHAADIRADIYSLGCTFFALLTGKAPFGGGSVMDKIKAHTERDVPPLSDFRNDVPPEIEAILRKMLAKDPAARFQTPAELAAALAPFAADATQTRAGLPAARPSRPRSRKQKVAIAAGLLLPLTIAAGVLVYLATDTGKLEIDNHAVDIPGAKIVLTKDGEEYASFDLQPGRKVQTIRAGRYKVFLRGAPRDVRMSVWTKRGDTNNWGEPDDFRNRLVAVYRGGGMIIEVQQRDPTPPPPPVSHGGPTGGIAEYRRFPAHAGQIDGVAFTPDGKYVISGSHDETVRIWDLARGEQAGVIEGVGEVVALAVSHDGRLLAVGTRGRQISLIDLANRKVVKTLGDDLQKVLSLAFSPDDRWLLSGDFGGTTRVWDVAEGKEFKRLTEDGPAIETVAFSADGRLTMAAAYDRTIRLWTTETGELVCRIDEGARDAALSPDGRLVAAAGTIFSVPSGEVVGQFQTVEAASDLHFTPDGRHVVACKRQRGLVISAVETGSEVASILPKVHDMLEAAVSADGRFLATGGFRSTDRNLAPDAAYELCVWRLPQMIWPQRGGDAGQAAAAPDVETIKALIPEATSIPNDEWAKLASDPQGPSPKHVTGMPLSMLLLTFDPVSAAKENPDVAKVFRYLTPQPPKPVQLAMAMWKSREQGYATIIQPEYITSVTLDIAGDTASGVVTYRAEGLYEGSVAYVARYADARWRIEELHLPGTPQSFRRDENGVWRSLMKPVN